MMKAVLEPRTPSPGFFVKTTPAFSRRSATSSSAFDLNPEMVEAAAHLRHRIVLIGSQAANANLHLPEHHADVGRTPVFYLGGEQLAAEMVDVEIGRRLRVLGDVVHVMGS